MSLIYILVCKEDNIVHNKAKCHVFALMVNLLKIVEPRYRPHSIVEHTNAMCHVSLHYWPLV